MTTLKYESNRHTMSVTHDATGDIESTLAFFGFCLVQHLHNKNTQNTYVSTPTTYRLHEITTHSVNGGAVITLTDGTNWLNVNINGISPEALCDGISAAQLQEVTE